jgi:hypothetical protein
MDGKKELIIWKESAFFGIADRIFCSSPTDPACGAHPGVYRFWRHGHGRDPVARSLSVCLVLGDLALSQRHHHLREKIEIVPVEDQVAFVPMKSTSPVVMTLDPRADLDE